MTSDLKRSLSNPVSFFERRSDFKSKEIDIPRFIMSIEF